MERTMQRRTMLGAIAGLVLAFGCKSEPSPTATSTQTEGAGKVEQVRLNGAGATFPYPLYSKWMTEYNRQKPNIQINYQSIGSGGGIRQVSSETVDFGASDAPMTADEAAKAPRKLLHIPTTVGAVALTYSAAGVKDLKLTGEVVADIYLGKITKWNDPKLAELNAGAALPATEIAVVYRSDGSGTTAVFTDYLAKVSSEFSSQVGQGKSVKWPKGLGAKGNEGVAGQIKTMPGSFGYVELAYATQNQLPIVALKNRAGDFVTPSIEAITAAAAGVEMPPELTASITDSPGKGAYPISAFTYILVYEEAKDTAKGKALAEFLWWAVHEGQQHAAPLHYAPLPAPVVAKVEGTLRTLSSGGQKLLSGS
jgi:phosphate transport system substrate-binding protein